MKRHKAAFAVCSICLRVRRGGEWVEATDVIREIRSYEFPVPPGLGPGVCDLCAEPILRRRAEAEQGLAALSEGDRRRSPARRSRSDASSNKRPGRAVPVYGRPE